MSRIRGSARRLFSVWHARNLEFVRDRQSLIFTLGVPVALVIAMALIFGGPPRPLFKVGVLGPMPAVADYPFLGERYFQFVPEAQPAAGIRAVLRNDLDLLLDLRGRPVSFWALEDSPKGYMAGKLLLQADPLARRQSISGKATRYIDWLFPGVLGMNMMFTCLMGAGYVVVRYRKNGFLKRLSATPVSAFEFLSAQVLSRVGLALAVTLILYSGIGTVIHFHNAGSLALLFLVALLGSLSLIAFGLIIAARFASEEVVGGMLNILMWPMMLLSGVWFSLEGSPHWMQMLAQLFPLTHILQAARAITLDGAGPSGIALDLAYLAGTTLVFLGVGAWSFRWRPE
ncbi:MAG TPA: ABC transporter permease [Steroidobacteraceae bacterium]|nr:ABC transporter permease [Steroidobacteraceae bacterium]